jgi:predicted nucleotide-binding protein
MAQCDTLEESLRYLEYEMAMMGHPCTSSQPRNNRLGRGTTGLNGESWAPEPARSAVGNCVRRGKSLPTSSYRDNLCVTPSPPGGDQVWGKRMTRPRIFIASAGESLDVAYAIQSSLERDADCTVWTQGVMRLSRATSQNLLKQLDNSDFGIFVFNPDDVLSSRGEEHAVARDNVVLELGMFAGRLGVESTFIVMPRGVDIRLPSDLLGLTVGEYATDRPDGNLVAALGPVCHAIRRELKDFRSGGKA